MSTPKRDPKELAAAMKQLEETNRVTMEIAADKVTLTAHIHGKVTTKVTERDKDGLFDLPELGGFEDDFPEKDGKLGLLLDDLHIAYEVEQVADVLRAAYK